MVTFTLAAIGICLFMFYKWATSNNDYFLEKNVKFVKPMFLLGSNSNFITQKRTMPEVISMLYQTFSKEGIIGLFEFRTPFYMIRDPELIKQIAIKDFDHFMDRRMMVDPQLDPMFAKSLVGLSGQKWKNMRSSLSPVFTGSKMRQMFHCVSDCGANMATYFTKEANKNGPQTYEMKEVFTRFTNDVIASSAFGIDVNSFEEKDNEFYKFGLKIVNFRSFATTLKFMGYIALPWLMKALKIHLLNDDASRYFQKVIGDNFHVRESKNIVRPDLIQLMLQMKKGQSIKTADEDSKPDTAFAAAAEYEVEKRTDKRQWNDEELMAQCFLFFLAGFDTASSLLSFTAYELAINTDVQELLFVEVLATNSELGGKNLTYEALQNMKYLDMVICEALRKWPNTPFIDRQCVHDYKLKYEKYDFAIEKGTFCWIPIYALHHDEKYFPNPQKFDPERFNEENKKNINTGAYLPFGIGPRNCIGSRFALMESKIVIYYLILNFYFEKTTKTQVPLKLTKGMAGFGAEKGIHLQFRPRRM